MRWDKDWGHDGGSVGAWIGMSLMMLVFWDLIAAVVVWAVRSTRRDEPTVDMDTHRTGVRSDPEALLTERFARGEIDEAEYSHRRDVLRGAGTPRPQ